MIVKGCGQFENKTFYAKNMAKIALFNLIFHYSQSDLEIKKMSGINTLDHSLSPQDQISKSF